MLDLSVEEKEQLKLERLQSTLNRACKNVPFHRNRFLEQQILPEDIISLNDLENCRLWIELIWAFIIHTVFLPFPCGIL